MTPRSPTHSFFTVYLPYWQLLRPTHWIKNTFVFAPLLFSSHFLILHDVMQSFIAFFIFSVAASCCYIFNDCLDIKEDQSNSIKSKNRPIANGDISPKKAYRLLLCLLSFLFFMLLTTPSLLLPIGCYLTLNAAYTLALKKIPVIDVTCIASGFVLRTLAGARAIHVPLSLWMSLACFSLAFFLATIKRQQEKNNIISLHSPLTSFRKINRTRQVLEHYSSPLLYSLIVGSGLIALGTYCFYVSVIHPNLWPSITFVIAGMSRYCYLALQKSKGECPTKTLLNDFFLAVCIIGWGLYVMVKL
jgi:decaprenyl-phosphate phosphoribosyltransferase